MSSAPRVGAPRVGVLKTSQCRPAGQRLFVIGRDVGQQLKQRIAAKIVRIIVVEIAGQYLVDALYQNPLTIVGDKLL